ncbi:E3 ubiquitin-protein ligase TRIM39-like [Rhineura floridana]|uniref:E3 ubiquitin-protein ligase TRIM39-like n=1 Tax=Rhineura floridana TaxID=261503 RepID=UPI002AC84D15|nr:E3 ubiquitin-protein ligase TRIM39-like [Rhineura floridana]
MAAAAAEEDPSVTLQDEATCSICLDYFQDPVMIIDCGHNFCRVCITQCQDGSDHSRSCCPQCRKAFPWDNLRPNRRLGNMADLIQRFRQQRVSEADGEQKACEKPKGAPKACEKHKEALKLFCLEDRSFICLVCRESRAHKAHTALPIDEAVQDYKDQIHSCLTTLKEERDKILKTKWCNEKKIQEMKRGMGCTRQHIVCMLPKEKPKTWLALLDACEENMKMFDEIASDFSERSSHLAKLIQEIEGKCLQSAFEFLQDIDLLLSRCETETSGKPKADLERKDKLFSEKMLLVQSKLNEFSAPPKLANEAAGGYRCPPPQHLSRPRNASAAAFPSTCCLAPSPAHPQQWQGGPAAAYSPAWQGGPAAAYSPAWQGRPAAAYSPAWQGRPAAAYSPAWQGGPAAPWSPAHPQQQRTHSREPWDLHPTVESLTFDEETAHPCLVVSRSGKSVRWGDDFLFNQYPCAQRFEQSRCVLSCEGFNFGWHIWNVEVVEEGPWAIGIAIESVRRKGPIHLHPNEGIWAMSFSSGNYWLHTSPKTPLALSFDPTVIEVGLQYETGQVTFSDYHSGVVLCAVDSLSFMGEAVHAFFRIGSRSCQLRLCSPAYLATISQM